MPTACVRYFGPGSGSFSVQPVQAASYWEEFRSGEREPAGGAPCASRSRCPIAPVCASSRSLSLMTTCVSIYTRPLLPAGARVAVGPRDGSTVTTSAESRICQSPGGLSFFGFWCTDSAVHHRDVHGASSPNRCRNWPVAAPATAFPFERHCRTSDSRSVVVLVRGSEDASA